MKFLRSFFIIIGIPKSLPIYERANYYFVYIPKKNRSNDTVDRSFNFKNWTKTKEERKKPQPHKSQEEKKITRRKKYEMIQLVGLKEGPVEDIHIL